MKCAICGKDHVKKFPIKLFVDKNDLSKFIIVGRGCLTNAIGYIGNLRSAFIDNNCKLTNCNYYVKSP